MNKERILLSDGNVYEFDSIHYFNNLFQIVFADGVILEPLLQDPSVFDSITILTRGGDIAAKYTGYSTIYKTNGNEIILSNDGSVYEPSEEIPTPPVVDPVEPDPGEGGEEPEPETPPTLEQARENKIAELSELCNQAIIYGVDLDINGENQHFSYKDEDQNNIKDAFDLAVQTGLAVPYHADNGTCTLYSAEDIIRLYVAEKTNLTFHQTYFNQMKMYIMSLDDIEEIQKIKYGDELQGEYLETYNTMMSQANSIINTLLQSIQEKEDDPDGPSHHVDPPSDEPAVIIYTPDVPLQIITQEIDNSGPDPHEGEPETPIPDIIQVIPVPPMPEPEIPEIDDTEGLEDGDADGDIN